MPMADYAPPPPDTRPNLGYGEPTEATIDQVNIWMRGQPWYQSQMRAWGQDPGHPTLTKDQSEQILHAAQAQGVVVDEGNMEVDDHGNFNPIGHKLRNTLLVLGIAGATIATMGAAGVFSGAAAGGAGAASGASAAGAAGAGAAGAAAGAGGAVGSGLGLGGGIAAAGGGASLVGDILRYGVPTAGSVIGGLIQAKATGAASDAQQKYLEEALAYQKEQDTYNRQRQATLDAQNVSRYNFGVQQEGGRYADYTSNIAPFIGAGQGASAKMASLLGLSGGAPSGGASGPSSGGTGQNFDPNYIGQQLDALYAKHGLTSTGPGSGPTDKAYFVNAIQKNGGWDPGYWEPRIAAELKKAGIADQALDQTPPVPSTNPISTQPLARLAGV